MLDAKNVKLGALVARSFLQFVYTYDFGDNWQHSVAIEAVTDADPALEYPRFIEGARRAPPEDVGGVPGFEELIKAMTAPRHPERKRMLVLYGRPSMRWILTYRL